MFYKFNSCFRSGAERQCGLYQSCLLNKVSLVFRNWHERTVHAIISSRMDYCNALYVSVSQLTLSRLKLVQNAAASLELNTSRCQHIVLVLLFSIHQFLFN